VAAVVVWHGNGPDRIRTLAPAREMFWIGPERRNVFATRRLWNFHRECSIVCAWNICRKVKANMLKSHLQRMIDWMAWADRREIAAIAG
jgi:hypothetical protein